ncbi:glycosyltransferase [Streptomyces sp. Rer75]|uniref:glycosyltransferase n=1 Tax=unclassified Streptomyces TaxID=2593676 RepID=UPI0015CFCCE2|nr:glycosyltransferase [Streptomyces sp. Rer75]QLH26661.1 glycosyltransferase [Streptomyces sp. Rer75]
MHVALVITGTRGDVQPFIALGRALDSRGHEVTLATHDEFETFVREAGLDFASLPGSTRDFLAHPALAEALQQGASLFRAARKVPRQSPENTRRLVARIAEVAASADLVVTSILSRITFEADDTTPWCSLSWWPLNPTSRWPAMMAPQAKLGPLYNRLTHRLAGMTDSLTANRFRKDAGLPPFPFGKPFDDLGREVPLFCPVSRTLFTEPPDWPDLSHITGYWFWDRKWSPPRELETFMADGTAPVALTFGSIWPVHQSAKTLDKVLDVVRSHGRRTVLVGGDPGALPDDVFHLTDAHYPWLFPRASVVIHHGGCNTTGEALRSGTPQVVVPTFLDSPFWAAQVHALGVAAKPVPYAKFSAEALDEALGHALTDQHLRAKAASIGETVRNEDGTGAAVDALEEWVRRWHERQSPAIPG